MNITQIENNLIKLIKNPNKETFIYELLLAYNLPKATVTRLQKGTANLSKVDGEVSLKNKLFFKEIYDEDLHLSIIKTAKDIKHDQRFVIVTDYKTLLAIDVKMNTTLDIPIKDLPKNYDFFLPWAGMEKAQLQDENPADIKAAVKMAKLFDEIKNDNEDDSPEFLHSLNIFLSRLLFCFFAEDTNIYKDNQFTNAIASNTQEDGSDLSKYLDKLFGVLNTPKSKRTGLPDYLNSFPYVNGGLFAQKNKAPNFSKSSRKVLIESGNQDWAAINPDIFGSMFQAVNHADNRGTLGQHFTSVPNIMKVIEPLFLNNLKEEFEKADGNTKKLNQLLYKLKNIKIFDPACGSGNFLIIAYKELRRLEMEIFKALGSLALSEISLSQFYGIELDDFAHEIAILALWLTKHQMNVEFYKEFGRSNPTLPLREAGNIVHGNACRLDWEEVCPKNKNDEIYILGNPPYLGFKMQNKNQKEDISFVFRNIKGFKKLDYISCWFMKASEYILNSNTQYSFVSTNSICQGEHSSLLWPHIFNLNNEIGFAHTTFKWSNNAKEKAAVFCCIVGVRNHSKKPKYLFSSNTQRQVDSINAYLSPSKSSIVFKRSSPLSNIPKMKLGNMPKDNGNLILSTKEKNHLLSEHPEAKSYLKLLLGAYEFLNGAERWCLWLKEDDLAIALKIPEIKERVANVKRFRLASSDKSANLMGSTPYKFREQHESIHASLIIPTVSSERRKYIPIGYLDKNTIIVAPNNAIYDPPNYLFSLLMSNMHMVWMKTFSGKLKSDYRYSSALCYNTFPFSRISKQRKEELTQCALNIIDERLKHSEKTMAQLYDPDKMPEGLREAHQQNDLAVERCYRSTPFSNDDERLEYLFKLYEKMIQEEKKTHKKK